MYVKTVEEVRDGTWQGGQSLWWSMADGVVDIAPMGSMVPDDVKSMVEAKRAELKGGTDNIFAGPVKNQAGEVVIPEGTKAEDGQLLSMDWFVEGVVGTTK
jgi:basic membrane protein A